MVPKFEKRVRAFAIDISGLSVALILSLFIKGTLQFILITVVFVVIYVVPHFFSSGQTFGKRIQKIKIVTMNDQPLKWYHAIIRDLTKMALSIATVGIYSIIAFFAITEKHVSRTIHDYIFNTKVIDLEGRNSNTIILNKTESIRKKGL